MAPNINKLAPIQIVAPKINKMAPKINKLAPIQTWHQKLIRWHQKKGKGEEENTSWETLKMGYLLLG